MAAGRGRTCARCMQPGRAFVGASWQQGKAARSLQLRPLEKQARSMGLGRAVAAPSSAKRNAMQRSPRRWRAAGRCRCAWPCGVARGEAFGRVRMEGRCDKSIAVCKNRTPAPMVKPYNGMKGAAGRKAVVGASSREGPSGRCVQWLRHVSRRARTSGNARPQLDIAEWVHRPLRSSGRARAARGTTTGCTQARAARGSARDNSSLSSKMNSRLGIGRPASGRAGP